MKKKSVNLITAVGVLVVLSGSLRRCKNLRGEARMPKRQKPMRRNLRRLFLLRPMM